MVSMGPTRAPGVDTSHPQIVYIFSNKVLQQIKGYFKSKKSLTVFPYDFEMVQGSPKMPFLGGYSIPPPGGSPRCPRFKEDTITWSFKDS